ncbi:hypothetical protein HAZT_HAZT009958 [Hyalella azteca]|uniref:Uncharacterized protein n=1 Tax=Hyalella azteca TaxID=294128 RepID=A0A6A0GXR0_HYAAZ|nr:hypothetical protein HAZT_HAZT009958 [Hyalella azteca]
MVECFLTFGGDPWKKDQFSNLPLSTAFSIGHFNTADILIHFMKDYRELEILDLRHQSDALFGSIILNMRRENKPIEMNFYKCIERLFRNDVKVSVSQDTLKLVSEEGDAEAIRLIWKAEPLQWSDALRILEENDSKKLTKVLNRVDNRIEFILRPTGAPNGITILHAAFEFSLSKKDECFDILLDCVQQSKDQFQDFNDYHVISSPLNEPNENGETVLHKAVSHLACQTVEKLLYLGADVNARDDDGNSPLHMLTKSSSKKALVSDAWYATADALLACPHLDTYALNCANESPVDGGTQAAMRLKWKIDERNSTAAEETRCPTSALYDCCLSRSVEEISKFFHSCNPDEPLCKSQYVGSQTVLCFVVSFVDHEILEEFLEMGYDPWQKNVNGKLPLGEALRLGYYQSVDLLIEWMKKKKSQKYIDLADLSFEYLNLTLVNGETEDSHSGPAVDHTKCLKRILREDVLLDVNALDTRGDGSNALQVAAVVNNQEAMQMLITKGAFIGTKRNVNGRESEGVLTAVLPETLNSAINNCVNVYNNQIFEDTDVAHPQFALKLDCSFLLFSPNPNQAREKDQSFHNTTRYELLLTGEHVIPGHYIGKFRFTVRNISRYFAWFMIPMLASIISLWFIYAPEFTNSVQFHAKRSKWKVVVRYEKALDSIMFLRNMLPKGYMSHYIDRFIRRFQQPNCKKPTILLKLNATNVKERMILSDGVHEYYRSVSDKLAYKFR